PTGVSVLPIEFNAACRTISTATAVTQGSLSQATTPPTSPDHFTRRVRGTGHHQGVRETGKVTTAVPLADVRLLPAGGGVGRAAGGYRYRRCNWLAMASSGRWHCRRRLDRTVAWRCLRRRR